MRFTPVLALALPALAAAQAQKPLGEQAKAWFDKAKSYIPTAAPQLPAAVKSPAAAAAAKIAATIVHPLSMSNYESLLEPDRSSKGPTEWMILVSGGNKTCGGNCEKLEVHWNETAAILAADPTAPKLGYINCDNQGILCTTWTAKPPTIWHVQRPVPNADQSEPATTVHITYLNFTQTTTQDMVALHTGKKFEDGYVYESMFNPFNGLLKQYGLNKAVGYVFFGFGLIPSWAFMLIVSMVSRQAM